MFTYTTCRDCGGILHVTNDDTVHPGCTPRPTRLERLLEDFRAAATMGDQPELEASLENEIDSLGATPPEMYLAALIYADWGWPVFPLLATGEANPHTGAISDGKKPATQHGLHDATRDPERIRAWWTRHPLHNIGLPTGVRFDVVDIDPRHDGMASYREILAKEQGQLRVHGKVATGNGGWHLYVKPRGGGNNVKLLPGIDIRGRGGYVVAPPSRLGDVEHRYQWMVKPSPAVRT